MKPILNKGGRAVSGLLLAFLAVFLFGTATGLGQDGASERSWEHVPFTAATEYADITTAILFLIAFSIFAIFILLLDVWMKKYCHPLPSNDIKPIPEHSYDVILENILHQLLLMNRNFEQMENSVGQGDSKNTPDADNELDVIQNNDLEGSHSDFQHSNKASMVNCDEFMRIYSESLKCLDEKNIPLSEIGGLYIKQTDDNDTYLASSGQFRLCESPHEADFWLAPDSSGNMWLAPSAKKLRNARSLKNDIANMFSDLFTVHPGDAGSEFGVVGPVLVSWREPHIEVQERGTLTLSSSLGRSAPNERLDDPG
jgi:hypothetical protein